MKFNISVRKATLDDAESISALIISAVKETNAKDYSPKVVAEVMTNFAPERVVARILDRQVFVAVLEGDVVGTASLDGNTIRSVFVLPNQQGNGIGRYLMGFIENVARGLKIEDLTVPSSITAEVFYKKLGYRSLRDEYYGEERTIVMQKKL